MPSATDCGFEDGQGGSAQALLIQFGPTLGVKIGFDPGYSSGGIDLPKLPDTLWPALVDTGTILSCIDSSLANLLGLPVVDRIPLSGVGGKEEFNVYLAQIYVPSLQFTTYGEFAGVHLTSGGQRHYALIGRSFLKDFNMIYNGKTGAVILSLLPGPDSHR